MIKRVAAINDLSGIGRCSLAVAMPILSTMGYQVCPLPTAILSAHTAFDIFEKLDTSDFLARALSAWERMGARFEAIYTGYLGAANQASDILAFMRAQPDALKLVDPVMGDDGKLYPGMGDDMIIAMRKMCAEADVITPNLTEAALLTGRELPRELTRKYVAEMLRELPGKSAVITSVRIEGSSYNVCRSVSGAIGFIPFESAERDYPGTGDIFASVLTGALLSGEDLPAAIARAAGFVSRVIIGSADFPDDVRFGVRLEEYLSEEFLRATRKPLSRS